VQANYNSAENSTAPAVFISHGSPMVAMERGPFQKALADFGARVSPKAIVAISAHWGSSTSISISAAERYETIHAGTGAAHSRTSQV
jgi:aromatic ring-opening dioxygenase catalytic subunit (LigB family)